MTVSSFINGVMIPQGDNHLTCFTHIAQKPGLCFYFVWKKNLTHTLFLIHISNHPCSIIDSASSTCLVNVDVPWGSGSSLSSFFSLYANVHHL